MARELAGKIALITGATAGIGRATALALAGAGANIIATGRNEAEGRRLVRQVESMGVQAHFIAADLGVLKDITALIPRTIELCGRIDLLINNAARPSVSSFMDTSLDEWTELHTVNLTAPFLLIQAAGQQMIDHGAGGRIVNVTSSSAFRAKLAPPAYAGTKAALTSLTRSAAAELGPYGINVNAVAPGPTATQMIVGQFGSVDALDAAMTEGPLANLLNRATQPEDAANVVLFLCSTASRQITAQTIHVSAGSIV